MNLDQLLEEENVDVLVVGAGPAGTVAARSASENGLRTTVLEAETVLGSPVHTSGATALQTMNQFNIPKQFYHNLKRIRFCGPKETALFEYDYPVGCVIDVQGMYQFLGETAQRAGARLVTNARAIKPIIEETFVKGCLVEIGQSTKIIKSKILIDASGYRATVSKASGLHPGFTRYGVGAEYDMIAPKCSQDEAILIVGKQFAPSGYAWVFPWGGKRVRIGVGVLHADTRVNPEDHLKKLCEQINNFGVDLDGSEIKEYHYGLIPAHGLAQRLAGDGIMAVGDAGGVASLVVGEGIRLSMASGELAGKIAAAAVLEGNFSSRRLGAYDREFRSKYGRNLKIGHIVNKRMASWDDDEWDEKLRTIKTVPPEIMASLLQSEFPFFNLITWATMRPSLWPKMIRYAIKGALSYIRI
jgi:digeranylgeranylglycerophospholipid reductase